MAETMEEEGLQEVDTYVTCQQNTFAQYIATGPIMYLCLEAERRPGTRVFKKWWEKDVLDLEGNGVPQERRRTLNPLRGGKQSS